MKILRVLFASGAIVALLGASAASITVPSAQIRAENARWRALGVKLPHGGVVLAHPYAPPYSNRSFVVPMSWYAPFYEELKKNKDPLVSAAAVREDLPTLEFLIQKTYAGYHTAAAHGWNWKHMFAQWNAQLAKQGDKRIPLLTAFAPWAQLERVQLDNHSGVPGVRAFQSGSASAVLAEQPQKACTALDFTGGKTEKLDVHDAGQQPHGVRSWNGTQLQPAWYVSYPQRDGVASAIRCGSQTIALTNIPMASALPEKPEYIALGNGISYLRLPTFNDASDHLLREALAKAPNLGKEKLVIFDLRGNQGGTAPGDILTNWFAESAIELAGEPATQFGTQSCFQTALDFNAQMQVLQGLKAPVSSALLPDLQQLIDSLSGKATPNCRVEPTVQRSEHNLAQHTFNLHPTQSGETRIIALVDNGCNSNCEYMTYILAGLTDTVIAGESTYGTMGFSQPGYFVLPNSRIPFRLALSRTDEYGDGRSVDGYGITADVVLPTTRSQSLQSLTALANLLVK